jgi:phosphoglycerate dehydrogenase-like enzyme
LVEPITGKTVLIIGLGHTGKAVAARCKAMGMITLGVRARYQDTPNVDKVYVNDSLPQLWSRADFIVLCVPRLDSTLGLVNSEAFAAMRPGVVLVDVSRGGVIEQQALINALDKHQIRGAALDVFETEPLPPENKLWAYDNVLITPHCSSVYAGWDLQSLRSFSQNLSRYRQGQSLHNVVDPIRGY